MVLIARRQADQLGLTGKGVYANNDEINAPGNQPATRNALLVDSPPLSLSGDVLRRAAELADGIANQQAKLSQLLSGQPGQGNMTLLPTHNTLVFPTPGPQASKGRRFTPEAIERIRAAQRRRWRKVRENQTQATAPTTAEATATNATH